MKFGVIAPYAVAPVESGEFAVAFAKLAEETGFESLWVVEHVVMPVEYESAYPYDPSGRSPFHAEVAQPDPLVWLSYVAAATDRIRLGTSVLILPQRNPLILAKEAASLDRLSGGRLELGIGVGWLREEAEAVGSCFEDRGRRADEYIEVMRTLWREPVASFTGRTVAFERMVSEPRPLQPGGVPIVVGGHSKAAARRAGRFGDGFFPLGVGGDDLRTLLSIMREAASACGRDPEAIALTRLAAADLASVEHAVDEGASRVIIAALDRDLASIQKSFERFRTDVMEKT